MTVPYHTYGVGVPEQPDPPGQDVPWLEEDDPWPDIEIPDGSEF